MKIALLANDTTYTYNLRREIIERLIQEGNEVVVIAEKLLYIKELQALGCEVVNIKISRHGKNPLSDIRLFIYYVKIMQVLKPDAVISFNIKPNSYGGMACQLLHIPFFPNITGLGTPLERPSKIQNLVIHLYKTGVRHSKCIFFQNSENKEFFIAHNMISDDTKTHLLPGSGVNLQSYPYIEYPVEGKIHFLFVARIMKEKGIDLFLDTATKIMSERDDCEFDICGMCDDEKYKKILYAAQKKGIIKYFGQQKDMKRFYNKCSCMLYPSYYPEGMSNVLLEAAATGRPLIVANRSGCREIVDDGINGYITKVNDKQSVYEATEKFLKLSVEKRRMMGLYSRKKVEKKFDRQIVVDAYVDELLIKV